MRLEEVTFVGEVSATLCTRGALNAKSERECDEPDDGVMDAGEAEDTVVDCEYVSTDSESDDVRVWW